MRIPALLAASMLACASALPACADDSPGRNVILLTLDGVRVQELFGGMDPVVSATEADSGIYEIGVTRERYWRGGPVERREALMPFFWKTLVPAGLVVGNPALGSGVTVRNDQWYSYPGYSEILTGEPQPDVKSNDFVRYPHRTVLDFVHAKLALPAAKVAQFGSWDGFRFAASQTGTGFVMNGAYDALPPGLSTPEIDGYVALRRQVLMLWEESSNDALSFRIALAYFRRHQPRLLWLGLGQSDDFAHARRYDRVLDQLHLADGWIRELWETVQSTDGYRDNTTLIVTADHGRGRTPQDWIDHDVGVQGSQDIWIAVIGPGTKAQGEVRGLAGVTQSDIAATILKCLGLDWREFNPKAGPPVPGACGS